MGQMVVTTKSTKGTRTRGEFEPAMVQVLKDSRRPLTLGEITERMIDRDLVEVQGETPDKSLYSIVSRNEKRRLERGEKPLFKKVRDGRYVKYVLNT
jgi:hypothetical protein